MRRRAIEVCGWRLNGSSEWCESQILPSDGFRMRPAELADVPHTYLMRAIHEGIKNVKLILDDHHSRVDERGAIPMRFRSWILIRDGGTANSVRGGFCRNLRPRLAGRRAFRRLLWRGLRGR